MLGHILLLTVIICGLTWQTFSQPKIKNLTIGLNASGDVLITKADGKRIGFDIVGKKAVNEIKDSVISNSTSGEPLYRFPVDETEKSLTIKVFGKTPQTKGNFSITGDGFVIRLIGLTLEPTKVLNITFQPNGGKIEFLSNQTEENLKFNFAADPTDVKQPSYVFKLERTNLAVNKKMSVGIDLNARTITVIDDSKQGSYSLNITRINPNGTENIFSQTEITAKKANRFQLNFKNWDGKGKMDFKIDKDGDGFNDEKPIQLDNETKPKPKK